MKIILTTSLPNLDARVDPRFGRGAYFITVDTDTLEWKAHYNPGVSAMGESSTKAAQFVVTQKPEAVICGDFPQSTYKTLSVAGIRMVRFGNSKTGREAIEKFKAGQLEYVTAIETVDLSN